jgi:hypothetical protein
LISTAESLRSKISLIEAPLTASPLGEDGQRLMASREERMNRQELVALQDALAAVLSWPDPVRDQVAQWLTPPVSKPGNGHVPHPPNTHGETSAPRPAKAPPQTKSNSKTAERKLLDALQGSAGSVSALAKAAGASKSSTGERLRRLAERGTVTKDSAGHWRLKVDPSADTRGPLADPLSAPLSS